MGRYLGLKVSKNGFGVKPLWRRRARLARVRSTKSKKAYSKHWPKSDTGYTFLYSPQNDGLSEKTNREGFFENKAFIVFKNN